MIYIHKSIWQRIRARLVSFGSCKWCAGYDKRTKQNLIMILYHKWLGNDYPKELALIIQHEVLHNILHRLMDYNTARKFDNIDGNLQLTGYYREMNKCEYYNGMKYNQKDCNLHNTYKAGDQPMSDQCPNNKDCARYVEYMKMLSEHRG